jgi:hypothetical protein
MSTLKQILANRRNAQKSSGATTPEGKAAVANNSRKHGLTGRFTVMPGENQEAFDNLFEQFMHDEKPVGSVEVELVRKMAEHTWLRERASRCQEACFVVMPQTSEQKKNDEAEVRVRPELERYIRYQSHHDRAYQRAAAELLKRQKERRLAEIGLVSQKRAEAEETRKAELQPYKVATAKASAERAQANATLRSIAAVGKISKILPLDLADAMPNFANAAVAQSLNLFLTACADALGVSIAPSTTRARSIAAPQVCPDPL